MLADLYAYIVSQDVTGMDPDRASALTSLRPLIGTRIFPDTLQEGVTDTSLVYQMIDNPVGHTLDGQNDGLWIPRVQIDVWALDPVTRENVAGYLKTALDGYIGTIGSTDVNVLLFDNEINTYESDRKWYRATLDFRVLHN